MKRDPVEKEKIDYFKRIQIKKIHPRFFYHQCNKCGYEYKNEMMYECSVPFFAWDMYYKGCSHCFSTIGDFRKWLEDNECIRTYNNYATTLINCNSCKYHVEFPPPHTCDMCKAIDVEERDGEYSMWENNE